MKGVAIRRYPSFAFSTKHWWQHWRNFLRAQPVHLFLRLQWTWIALDAGWNFTQNHLEPSIPLLVVQTQQHVTAFLYRQRHTFLRMMLLAAIAVAARSLLLFLETRNSILKSSKCSCFLRPIQHSRAAAATARREWLDLIIIIPAILSVAIGSVINHATSILQLQQSFSTTGCSIVLPLVLLEPLLDLRVGLVLQAILFVVVTSDDETTRDQSTYLLLLLFIISWTLVFYCHWRCLRKRQRRRGVSFGTVQVREYKVICGGGLCEAYNLEGIRVFPITPCPISLDWSYVELEIVSVERLELTRTKGGIRSRDSLHLDPAERRKRIISMK